jgi:hypothetical protein
MAVVEALDSIEFGKNFPITELAPGVHVQEVEPLYEVREPLTVVNVPIESINILAQHRMGRNDKQAELNASIEADIKDGRPAPNYPIDITSLDKRTLEEYIDFTNRVWGADKTLEDFTENQPGRYLVVISGHSRLESFHAYSSKYNIPKDRLGIRCQFKTINTIDEFLHEQIKENIHSAPPPERAARGYAEAFLYARTNNPNLSKEAFCRHNGIRVSKLSESLFYADLPPEYREFTDSGKLKFSVAVELGRALPWLVKDSKAFFEAKGHPADTLDQAVQERVDGELERYLSLYNGYYNRHVTNTKKRIQHDVNVIKKSLCPDPEEETDLELTLFDARDGQQETNIIIEEVKMLLGRIQLSTEVDKRALHNGIARLLDSPELEIDTETIEALKNLGDTAITATQETLI